MENRISTGLRTRFVWLRQLSRRTGEFAVVQIACRDCPLNLNLVNCAFDTSMSDTCTRIEAKKRLPNNPHFEPRIHFEKSSDRVLSHLN